MSRRPRVPLRALHGSRRLRATDLRRADAVSPRARLHPGALSLALGLTLAACGGSETPKPDPGLDSTLVTTCQPDGSIDVTTAIALTLTSSASCRPGESRCVDDVKDALCPRRDADYYRITVDSPSTLLTVDVTYEKLSSMRLAVDLIAPGGVTTSAIEPTVTSTLHRIQATFAAPAAGDYVLKVYDAVSLVDDAATRYVLHVGEKADPDSFEPNDTEATAAGPSEAELAAGATGYLASEGDVDWYRLTPSVTPTQPVIVHAELRWPESLAVTPQLRLVQGTGWSYVPTAADSFSETVDGVRYRVVRLQRIAPTNAPIDAEVKADGSGSDASFAYSLVLTTKADAFEGAVRDDRPETARIFDAASPPATPFEQTLAASGDLDWYRIDVAASTAHELVHLVAAAPLGLAPDFLLKMLVYRPTGASCTDDAGCSGGICDTLQGTCLEPWVQRPARFGPADCVDLCDPQRGGLSPNYLDAQLPVQGTGSGTLYVRIGHITETQLDVPGYSLTDASTYTLTIETLAEPDAADATTTPDNTFVAEPLEPGVDLASTAAAPRPLTDGVDFTAIPASPGAPFVAFADGSEVPTTTCQPLTLYAFDAYGAPASGTTSVTLPAGFVTDCASFVSATTVDIVDTNGTVYFDASATTTADLAHTVDLIVGTTTLTVALPIVDAAAAPAPSFTYARASGGVFLSYVPLTSAGIPTARSLVVTGASPLYRIGLSPAATSATTLQVAVSSANAELACGDNALDAPPSFGGTSCSWSLAAGATSRDFQVRATSAGPVLLDVTALGYAPSTLVLGAYGGASLVRTATWTTGFISYEGDQDFFSTALPAGFTKGGASLFVRHPASSVDLRVALARGPSLVGTAYLAPGNDICGTSGCTSGSCDARNQCSAPSIDAAVGVAAGDCVYMYEPGDLLVWANETNANDWDTVQPYELQLEVTEGCPATCSSYICSQ